LPLDEAKVKLAALATKPVKLYEGYQKSIKNGEDTGGKLGGPMRLK